MWGIFWTRSRLCFYHVSEFCGRVYICVMHYVSTIKGLVSADTHAHRHTLMTKCAIPLHGFCAATASAGGAIDCNPVTRSQCIVVFSHCSAGDRTLALPWAGSVLDAVIATFLTQNVSDQLSAAAFIEFSGRFRFVFPTAVPPWQAFSAPLQFCKLLVSRGHPFGFNRHTAIV